MSSICAEQQHNLHTSHQLISSKKSLKTIDIPPRKLLNRRLISEPDMYFSDDTLFQKFLSNNSVGGDNLDDSDSGSDPYSSDHFRMYELKVRRCTRSRSHDWTDCPFAHPGEKARRRDPRRFHYTGQVCPEYRRGSCSRGDSCEFAHGVFECWLHPARYRTEACKDGKNCKRKVCFFAHTPRQLRVLPLNSHHSSPELACKKKLTSNHCCLFCHCANSSPTSTLLGMSHLSPPLSPPLSPGKHRSINGFSPISRYADRFVSSESSGGMHFQMNNHGVQSYKDPLTELMSSLEGMNFSETSSPLCAKSPNVPWLDVSFNNETSSPLSAKSPNVPWLDVSFNNINIEDQQQFILSPSTPNPPSFRSTNFFSGDCSSKSFADETNNNNGEYNKVNENGWSCPDLDLGWVNELLM